MKNSRKVGYGFNALNETYCDMISAGIVDPTKVTDRKSTRLNSSHL